MPILIASGREGHAATTCSRSPSLSHSSAVESAVVTDSASRTPCPVATSEPASRIANPSSPVRVRMPPPFAIEPDGVESAVSERSGCAIEPTPTSPPDPASSHREAAPRTSQCRDCCGPRGTIRRRCRLRSPSLSGPRRPTDRRLGRSVLRGETNSSRPTRTWQHPSDSSSQWAALLQARGAQ